MDTTITYPLDREEYKAKVWEWFSALAPDKQLEVLDYVMRNIPGQSRVIAEGTVDIDKAT